MITLRIPNKVQWALFSAFAMSFVSGSLFFILKTWFLIEGDFGLEKHPWQYPLLKIHAASAFILMLLYGALWASHIQFGWRTKRSRKSGSAMVLVVGLQIVTAYLLYYLSNQTMRVITEYVHLFVGLTLPVTLALHIYLGRRNKAKH